MLQHDTESNYHNKKDGWINLTGSKEECDKALELMNLFANVSLNTIKKMYNTDVGSLARAVLTSDLDNEAVRCLVDELLGEWNAGDTSKFVSRMALENELEDVLRAKSISAYRRSRINRAMKRACIACYGSGKAPVKKTTDRGLPGISRPTQRWEVSSYGPDCIHCKGTGIHHKKNSPEVNEINDSGGEREYPGEVEVTMHDEQDDTFSMSVDQVKFK